MSVNSFDNALKQSSAVRRDLDVFAENPAASSPALQGQSHSMLQHIDLLLSGQLDGNGRRFNQSFKGTPTWELNILLGQISASLTSLSRTIDDYSETAKKELIPAKQEKAHDRVKTFRSDLLDYRQTFARLKKDREDSTTQARTELLGRRPHHTSTPENPYTQQSLPFSSPLFSTNRGGPSSSQQQQLDFGVSPNDYTRETHALREQSFMTSTNAALDEYLERGRAVLGDLGQQKEILKGTQRRLYSVANTLGVSGETIRMVERRAKQDKWIFWVGCVVFFGFCWFIIHYLR
ncbi:MAG: hypothetical protein Q9166_005170 [cf. Caloplaca sp. 2 TL-2023]